MLAIGLLFLLFFRSIFLEIPYVIYSLWPVKALVLIFLILYLRQKWYFELNTSFTNYILLIFLIFVALMLVFGGESDGRYSFVFGPNVLYRVLIFFAITSIVLIRDDHKSKFYSVFIELSIIFVLATLLAMIGSRGGIVVFMLIYAIISLKLMRKSRTVLLALILIPLSMFLLIFVLDGSRVLYFTGLEQNLRFLFIYDFLSLIPDMPLQGFTWSDFVPYARYGFVYPHNMVLELLFYYGILGVVVLTVVLLSMRPMMILLLRENGDVYSKIIAAAFFIFLFSSLLSGDLTDNFPVVAIALYSIIPDRKVRVMDSKIKFSRNTA